MNFGEVILIRHAETDLAGRFCGHSNPPLNIQGVGQLPVLMNKLAKWKNTALYSSDLLRAQQTALAIAQRYLVPVQMRSGLREIFFGEWEGLSWPEIENRNSGEAKRWIEEYPHRCTPGGEDYRSFTARVQAEADFLFNEAKNGRVAAVTHAGVMRTILSLRCKVDSRQAWQWTKDYGSVIVITGQGRVAYTSTEVSYD